MGESLCLFCRRQRQRALCVQTGRLARGPGHTLYPRRLNQLNKHGFEDFVEGQCSRHYSEKLGRPSLPPVTYFRLPLIGYFEGINFEGGVAWRFANSISLREFLGYTVSGPTPDRSTPSRTRQLLDVDMHQEVLSWVVSSLAKSGLLRGKSLGLDAAALEANAALCSFGLRDTSEVYCDSLEA